MTSCGGGSPVGWDKGGRGGGGGKGRAPLSRRALLGGRVPLNKRVVF